MLGLGNFLTTPTQPVFRFVDSVRDALRRGTATRLSFPGADYALPLV